MEPYFASGFSCPLMIKMYLGTLWAILITRTQSLWSYVNTCASKSIDFSVKKIHFSFNHFCFRSIINGRSSIIVNSHLIQGWVLGILNLFWAAQNTFRHVLSQILIIYDNNECNLFVDLVEWWMATRLNRKHSSMLTSTMLSKVIHL